MTFFSSHRSGQYLALTVGLAAATALTIPGLSDTAAWGLEASLWVCLAFFAMACARTVRLVLAGDRSTGRLAELALDALAIVPVPTALALGSRPPTAWLLAYLWVFTLHRISSGLAMLVRVLRHEARALSGVFVLFLIVLFLSAAAMHLSERELQPDAFASMPQALWWAITTLTTTGYGDVVPHSAQGRALAGFVMVSGIGVLALFAGILATGFASESRREDMLKTWDLVASVPFFRALGPSAMVELVGHMRRWEARRGTVVIRRGTGGDSMYFLVRGEMEVRLPAGPLRLQSGTFFGEMALLTGAPRVADVVAVKPSTLLILDLIDFRKIAARYPDLATAIAAEAARRGQKDEADRPAE